MKLTYKASDNAQQYYKKERNTFIATNIMKGLACATFGAIAMSSGFDSVLNAGLTLVSAGVSARSAVDAVKGALKAKKLHDQSRDPRNKGQAVHVTENFSLS